MKKDIPFECAETRSADAQRGFALVIALSLMAFILLLLLSITTLVRVETQSSLISLARMEARQNALLGLQIAIGELQEHTGVDQVATGTSAYIFGRPTLVSPVPPTVTDPDNPPPPPSLTVTQKHWTGVWTQSPLEEQPRHLMWLVSGNEHINPEIPFYQEGSSLQTKLDARPVVPNTSLAADSVWMVHDGSVDASSTDDFVQVPKVTISGDSDGSGAYAWWASDESLKANVSVGRPADNTLGADDSELRVATAQRLTGSAMAGFSSLPEDEATLSALPNVETIPLLAPGITDADFEDRFHDITVHSRGLLSNSRDGGLKKDLTAAFSGSGSQFASLTSAYGSQIFPAVDADGNTVGSSGDNPGGPTWAQLRSFVNMRPESGDGNGLSATKTMQTQTNTQMGVYPVISSFQMYLTASEVSFTTTDKTLRLWLLPSISFWNPYNVRIQVPTTYLRVVNNRSWQSQDFRFVAWLYDAANVFVGALASIGGAPDYPLRFEIDSFTIEPGETLIFSPPSQASWSNPMRLAEGWSPDNGYYLEATNAAFLNATQFVVGVNDAYQSRQYIEKLNLDWTTDDLLDSSGNATQVVIPDGEVIQKINSLFAQTAADGRPGNPLDRGYQHPPIYPLVSGSPLSLAKWGYDYRLTFSDSSIDYYPTGGAGSNYNIYSRIPWLGVGNPRARFHNLSAVEISNESNSGPPAYTYNGGTVALSRSQNDQMYDYEVAFGSGIFDGSFAKSHTTLFQIPQSNAQVLGIGDLMHANLSNDLIDSSTDWGSSGGKSTPSVISWMNTARYRANDITPAYAIGNSLADPRIAPDKQAIDWSTTNFFVTGDPSRNSQNSRGWHYDYSYLLNRALWDDFFFSGVPSGGVGSLPLPHSLYEVEEGATTADLTDFDRAAANITQRGAFNVNSVSEEAWKAVLSAFLGESVEIEAGDRSDPDEAPILRMIKPKLDAFDPTSAAYFDDEGYAGFRRLTTAEIDSLAKAIVAEYKERRPAVGPFIALADFVNRQVKRGAADEHKREGLLQAAIDPIDDGEGDPSNAVNGSWNLNHVFHDVGQVIEQPNDTTDDGYGDLGFHQLQGGVGAQIPEPDHLASPVAFGAPGFLMQADILARIGNLLTVRGDTFKIRVYGESKNSITGGVNARAYGEAVIQRATEYVDTTDAEDTFPPSSTVNQNFGRRYKLVSFHWLDAEDV